jgi:hypothetical protein
MSLKPDSSGAGDEALAMRPSVVAGLSAIASLAMGSRFTAGKVVQALRASAMANAMTGPMILDHTRFNIPATPCGHCAWASVGHRNRPLTPLCSNGCAFKSAGTMPTTRSCETRGQGLRCRLVAPSGAICTIAFQTFPGDIGWLPFNT